MSDVQFEEDQAYAAPAAARPAARDRLAAWLVEKRLAKTTDGANRILLTVAVAGLAITLWLVLTGLGNPAGAPSAEERARLEASTRPR